MDLLDRLLEHDAWTTRHMLDICAALADELLDLEFDIGHRTLRATFDHMIHNMEVWSALMAQQPVERQSDRSIPGLIRRLDGAAARFKSVARAIAARNAWDDKWLDHLDVPPREKTYGAGIAHIITHNMHHRAQVLYMLRLSCVANPPEGDVFSWETSLSTPAPNTPSEVIDHEAQQYRVRIRRYLDQDEAAVTALWREALADAAPHNDPATSLRKKAEFGDDLLFVADIGGVSVGTVMGGYDGHRGWVYSVAVAEAHRRRGVGTALVRRLESALAELGCLKVNLQVRASNAGVLAFYERLGYLAEERLSMGKRLY